MRCIVKKGFDVPKRIDGEYTRFDPGEIVEAEYVRKGFFVGRVHVRRGNDNAYMSRDLASRILEPAEPS